MRKNENVFKDYKFERPNKFLPLKNIEICSTIQIENMKKQDIYFIFTVIHDQYDEQTYQERVVEEKKIDTTPCV